MWIIYKTIFDGYNEEGNEVFRKTSIEDRFIDLNKAKEKFYELKSHVENGEYVSYELEEISKFNIEDWEYNVYLETMGKLQEIIRQTLDQAQIEGQISEKEKTQLIDWYKYFDLDWEYFYICGDNYIKEYKKGEI